MEFQGPFPKPQKKEKPKARLKSRTPLKSHYEPIPTEIKEATLEQKGSLCFCGYCPNCGGQATVTKNHSFHHFPYRSHHGQNIPEHLWPCLPDCHRFMHDNPYIERMVFKEIEEAGIPVVWKVKGKGIGA